MYEQHSLHRSTPELSFESGLRIPSSPSSLPLIVSLRSQLLFSPSIHREKKSCRYSKQNMSHAFPSLRTIGLQRTTSQSIGSEQEDNTVSQNFTVDDDVRFASRAPAETTRTPSDFSIILSLVRPYTRTHTHTYTRPLINSRRSAMIHPCMCSLDLSWIQLIVAQAILIVFLRR